MKRYYIIDRTGTLFIKDRKWKTIVDTKKDYSKFNEEHVKEIKILTEELNKKEENYK